MAGRGWGRLSASTSGWGYLLLGRSHSKSGCWMTEGQLSESTLPEVRATLPSLDRGCHFRLGRGLRTDHPPAPRSPPHRPEAVPILHACRPHQVPRCSSVLTATETRTQTRPGSESSKDGVAEIWF